MINFKLNTVFLPLLAGALLVSSFFITTVIYMRWGKTAW